MTIFGTRPEAIKMAPLVLELKKNKDIECIVCVTAQHRQMLDQVLSIFNIVPDFDLDIMEPSQTLSTITAKAITKLDEVFNEIKPDLVLVHGDTSTTFASALSAFYHKIKVGHVEAGLRTYDKFSPFPEEMNRRLTGDIADLHFAPTKANADNLVSERIGGGIFITGNTVIDALKNTVKSDYVFQDPTLAEIDFNKERVVLVTAHRRENYGEAFDNIMQAILDIKQQNPDVRIVYPVHLSPVVREAAGKYLKGVPGIDLIDPLMVDEMHNLMARSYLIMTDSGGLQEEAPALGKPVLVLRRETERPEAIRAGTVKLAGVIRKNIVEMANELLSSETEYEKMAKAVNPYGDGKASERITQAILWSFGRIAEAPENFRT